jgi:hypothetical protein
MRLIGRGPGRRRRRFIMRTRIKALVAVVMATAAIGGVLAAPSPQLYPWS